MSGIAGIIHLDGRPVEPGHIQTMTAAMDYRGPDGINHWISGSVALGQCMLRTTPESLEETQPLTNEDASLVLVMDGRLDNWEELRRELLGHGARLRTRADAELLLRAYETWGERCVEHIDGDFAFAIWDTRRDALFCARDRVGIKPFHFAWRKNTFCLATDVQALLLTSFVEDDLNEGRIAEYLADAQFSRTETFYLHCNQLPAGTAMTVNAQGPRYHRYWEPEKIPDMPAGPIEEFVERLTELIACATRRRMRSHLPIGSLLSGGIDSTMTTCTAAGLARSMPGRPTEVESYSLVYPNMDCDERPEIEQLLARTGLHGHFFDGSAIDLEHWHRSLTACAGQLDSPTGMAFYRLYAKAATRSRVILGGWGADDWLGGQTSTYADLLAKAKLPALAARLRHDRSRLGLREAINRQLRYGVRPHLRKLLESSPGGSYLLQKRCSSATLIPWLSPLMAEKWQQRANAARVQHKGLSHHRRSLLNWLQSGMFANNTVLQEHGCALHRIEGRYPYHDRAIVEFGFALPLAVREQSIAYKLLLHRAFRYRFPSLTDHLFSDPDGSAIYRQMVLRVLSSQGTATPRMAAKDWTVTRPLDFFGDSWLSQSVPRTNFSNQQIRTVWQLIATEAWLNRIQDGGKSGDTT